MTREVDGQSMGSLRASALCDCDFLPVVVADMLAVCGMLGRYQQLSTCQAYGCKDTHELGTIWIIDVKLWNKKEVRSRKETQLGLYALD